MKILVAEKSSNMKEVFNKIFEGRSDVEIIFLDNGASVVEKFKDDVNAAFVELDLPDKDGFSLIKEVKKMRSDAKIVLLSSLRQNCVVEEGKKKGAFDFISKPFNKERIKEGNEKLS
jgi:two-component system chemotaxis response regulator CheY